MEPFDYPRSDPGPNTLLSNIPNADNIQRLLWALGQIAVLAPARRAAALPPAHAMRGL